MVLKFFMLAGIFFFVSCSDVERDNPDDPGGKNYKGGVSSSSVPSSSSVAVSSSSSKPSSSSAEWSLSCRVKVAEGLNTSTVNMNVPENYKPEVKCAETANPSVFILIEGNDIIWSNTPGQRGNTWISPPVAGNFDSIRVKVDYDSDTAAVKACQGFEALCAGTFIILCPVTGCATISSSSRMPSSSSVPLSSSSVLPSSSSVAIIFSSSSSLPIGMVWCMVGENCVSIAPETCTILGGQIVQSCQAASSSSVAPSSSSAVVPSSSSKPSSSSSAPPSSSSGLCAGFVDGTKREHYGMQKEQFCDVRDGKKYVYVKIGSSSSTQTWMAENLNYNINITTNSFNNKCYENQESNCQIYGRLYDWATAMALPSTCNSTYCGSQINAKHRGICPSGWHIPSEAEWNALKTAVGDATAGTKLKTKEGWNSYSSVPAGTDDYGFSALPGGWGNSDVSLFNLIGNTGYYWSSAEQSGPLNAVSMILSNNIEYVFLGSSSPINSHSVRCLKD